MHRATALSLCVLTVIAPGCAVSVDSGDSAASGELVQSSCRSRTAYLETCMVETDGFDEDACKVWFAKNYRTDVLSAIAHCYEAASAGSCDSSSCREAVADDLHLTPEQNRDEPTLKACVARFVQCGGDDSGAWRCDQVLLYTNAGREKARRCFTQAAACADLWDCIRFPHLF